MSQSASSSITRAVDKPSVTILGWEVSGCKQAIQYAASTYFLAKLRCARQHPTMVFLCGSFSGRPLREGNDLFGTSSPFTPGSSSAVKPERDDEREKASSLSGRSGRLTTKIC